MFIIQNLDYPDYLVNFESLFRDKRNLDILSNEDLNFVKAKTKEAALSLIELRIIMCFKIFLRMNSLLQKLDRSEICGNCGNTGFQS